MAVPWRRARTPSLDSQRWRVLTVNGQQYLIKALFDDQGYHMIISDLSSVWEEDPGAEKIVRRGKVGLSAVDVPRPHTRERERERESCLLYTSPSPRDATLSRMPSSA